MQRTTLHSGCKVNLYLRVGPKKPSGMHDIDSLFLPLAVPCDSITLSPPLPGNSGVHVRFMDAAGMALTDIDSQRNTLAKAWQWFFRTSGFALPLSIQVRKEVPRGAGLGGGSANAAALLLFLYNAAKEQNVSLPHWELFCQGSAAIGADVPFFLFNRPARAQGVGEQLCACAPPFAGHHLLLVCPDIHINTAWAFAELDRHRSSAKALVAPPACQQPSDFCNDFEEVIFSHYPALGQLHAELAASGAVLARMSGTGASLFALYADKKNACDMQKALVRRAMSVYMHPLPQHYGAATRAGV